MRWDVALYQTSLNKKLHSKLKVDGSYGPMTALATLEFQKIHHLKLVDGVVGAETWKAVTTKARRLPPPRSKRYPSASYGAPPVPLGPAELFFGRRIYRPHCPRNAVKSAPRGLAPRAIWRR